MRPKLHADTLYMPTADGVYVRNNRSSLTLRGETTYRWLEKLVPYFNGQYELEQITGGLDVSRKTLVTDLVEALFTHHFLSDASLDQPHTLSKEDLVTYASEIAFVESFQSSAARLFETFRQTRLLVIGSGLAFSACVRSCLYSGIMHLTVIKTAEESVPGTFSTIDNARLLLPRDASQHIQEISPPHWDDRAMILHTIKPFDAILHISDRPMLARTRLLNALCVEQQKLFLQTCFVHNRAWVGPLVQPGSEGCWECAWRRLQSNVQEAEQRSLYVLEDQETATPGRWFAFPVAALAANQLVFELFRAVTQASSLESASRISSIDLETLACRGHAFLPHFQCQSCQHPSAPTEASFLAQVQQLERQEPLDSTTFSKQAARCFNDQVGIFRSIDEGNFEQIPLAVCKVEIADPTAQQCQPQEQSVIAVGIDFQDARQRATQRACEVYASRAVDPQCLVMQIQKPHLVVPHERFLTTTQPSTIESWCWALRLSTGQPCLVPASLVFPTLQPEETTRVGECGVSSAMSWSEALCRALLDWACNLTSAQINDRQHPYPKIDLDTISWTPGGKHLFALLTTAEALPDVYDVTGSLGVPTFAVCMREQTTVYVSHYDALEALSCGLELALQHFQSCFAQQSAYDVEPGLLLAFPLRSDQSSALRDVTIPQGWPERLLWIQQRFQEQGWYTLAVPLTQDAALANVLPFLVCVLLVRGERKG